MPVSNGYYVLEMADTKHLLHYVTPGPRHKSVSHVPIYIVNYSTLPRGISINIAPKIVIFPESEGRGKYSLPRVQYYRYFTRKG